MSDFVSEFWSIWIATIVLSGLVWLAYLIGWQARIKASKYEQVKTTGHIWDEDLSEHTHPLPFWWILMFYATLAFAVVYLILYPGLGSWKGIFDWTSVSQYHTERAQAEAKYQPLYDQFMRQDVKTLASDPRAQKMGKRLFQTYCVQCHGMDARGAKGYPNLTDNKWLWGGDIQTIHTTISEGRHGQMPAWGAAFGEEKVKDVAHYVLSLSKRNHDAERATRGKNSFDKVCVVCHGTGGKGNQQLGAPNLTDNNWLYGGSEKTIIETITNGRNNQMPAWKDFLGDGKVHLLTAYVWSLSHPPRPLQ